MERVVDREDPENLRPISFRSNNLVNNPGFGIINLCCWQNDVENIDDNERIVIDSNEIDIYFPIFSRYYVKKYSSDEGFSFKELVRMIVETGLAGGEYDITENPQHYRGAVTKEDFINRYAVTSSSNGSDIGVSRNRVFVQVQE